MESLRRDQQSLTQSNMGVPSKREIKDMLINTFSNRQSEVRQNLEQVPTEKEVLDIIRNSERQGDRVEAEPEQRPIEVPVTRIQEDQVRTKVQSQSTTIVTNRVDHSKVSSSRYYENSNAFLRENKKFDESKDTSFVISGLKVTRKSNARGGLRKWSQQDRIEEEVEEQEQPLSSRVVVAKSTVTKPAQSTRQVRAVTKTSQRASNYTNRVYSKSVTVKNKRRFKLDEM